MPAHDGARSHDQPHPGQPLNGQRSGQQRQPRPVRFSHHLAPATIKTKSWFVRKNTTAGLLAKNYANLNPMANYNAKSSGRRT
jgi:hypothetical protein